MNKDTIAMIVIFSTSLMIASYIAYMTNQESKYEFMCNKQNGIVLKDLDGYRFCVNKDYVKSIDLGD